MPLSSVSIHAPTQGATKIGAPQIQNWQSFNPRTHTGCDLYNTICSIISSSFNPRTHTGCDQTFTLPPLSASFQSTHPHRVRPFIVILFCPCFGFNPRTHTGCDALDASELSKFLVSIHAPTQGATSACTRL